MKNGLASIKNIMKFIEYFLYDDCSCHIDIWSCKRLARIAHQIWNIWKWKFYFWQIVFATGFNGQMHCGKNNWNEYLNESGPPQWWIVQMICFRFILFHQCGVIIQCITVLPTNCHWVGCQIGTIRRMSSPQHQQQWRQQLQYVQPYLMILAAAICSIFMSMHSFTHHRSYCQFISLFVQVCVFFYCEKGPHWLIFIKFFFIHLLTYSIINRRNCSLVNMPEDIKVSHRSRKRVKEVKRKARPGS